jgi:tetratricopeptide (TPR) repeat protein
MADRPDLALDHFGAAARLDPTNPQPLLYAAQINLRSGRLDQAASRLDRVLELEPGLPVALATLAAVELQRENEQRAIELADRALRLEPANLDLRVQAAKIRRKAGRPQAALELLVGLSPKQRGTSAVTYELAAAYEAAEMHDPALASWSNLYNTAPTAALAMESAARAGLAALELEEPSLAAAWRTRAEEALGRVLPDTSGEREIAESRTAARQWLSRLERGIADAGESAQSAVDPADDDRGLEDEETAP